MSTNRNHNANVRTGSLFLVGSLLVVAANLPASAQSTAQQGTTTLRDPLILGTIAEPPGTPMTPGQAPPTGNASSLYKTVTPGMTQSPTLPPWVTTVPANSIDLTNTAITLPIAPSGTEAAQDARTLLVPYSNMVPSATVPTNALRKTLGTIIPGPSSNPASDKNNIPSDIVPTMSGYKPPVAVVRIGVTSGITGSAPTTKWGAQTTTDLYGTPLRQLQNLPSQKLVAPY